MVPDHDYVVDAAELPTSAFSPRLLSGLKCEVVLHHAETSLQQLIILISFIVCLHAIIRWFHSICHC
jgi:hypothetical protein